MQCASNRYLVYPYPAQHFVNGLAIAAQALHLSGGTDSIPVKVSSKTGEYRSPFALSLDASQAEAIAQDIKDIVQNYLKAQIGLTLPLSTSSGWITLHLTTAMQLECLYQLIDRSPQSCSFQNKAESWSSVTTLDPRAFQQLPNVESFQPLAACRVTRDFVFSLQYAHARCCSVLRLVNHQARPLSPIPVAWLERFFHLQANSPEQDLLLQLINFPQGLQVGNHLTSTVQRRSLPDTCQMLALVELPQSMEPKHVQALVTGWANLFQQFYAGAPVCPLRLPESRSLLTLRLALFQALRNLIEFLLTTVCDHSAPQIL